jgi:mannose-1-phosphate guanylyltransferase
MSTPIVAVVLAGGVGTRLYPASRPTRPKQFAALLGDTSLLSGTVRRTDFADETHVLTRADFAAAVPDHAPEAGVLVEPEPKDTGPALVYAAHRLREQVGECVLLSLPADHFVGDDAAFAATARRACRVAAETGALVTVGVEPTRPATGYGYIEPGADRGDHFVVQAFHEKPDAETAARYVAAGQFWNAGLFAWTPTALLDAARDTPLGPLVEALDAGASDPFDAVEAVSIDYAVLERAADVVVVPADFAWDDVGAWDALGRVLETDGAGNAVVGDALAIDTRDSVIATDGDLHVSAVGVSDLVVAAYDDRVLVVPTGEAQRVREVVARLREDGRF